MGMDTRHADRLLNSTKALRAALVVLLAQVDAHSDLVEELACGEHFLAAAGPPLAESESAGLRVDRSRYSVKWHDETCVLGRTMEFRLLERLARSHNHYLSVDRLLDELWNGECAYPTVRSAICRLRRALRKSGATDLADRIDGHVHGHYGLMLEDT